MEGGRILSFSSWILLGLTTPLLVTNPQFRMWGSTWRQLWSSAEPWISSQLPSPSHVSLDHHCSGGKASSFWGVSWLENSHFFFVRRVRLTFLDFDLEPASFNPRNNKTSCYYDYVMVSSVSIFSFWPKDILSKWTWIEDASCAALVFIDIDKKCVWRATDDPCGSQRLMIRPIYTLLMPMTWYSCLQTTGVL